MLPVAFSRVPKDSALHDNVRFYIVICAAGNWHCQPILSNEPRAAPRTHFVKADNISKVINRLGMECEWYIQLTQPIGRVPNHGSPYAIGIVGFARNNSEIVKA